MPTLSRSASRASTQIHLEIRERLVSGAYSPGARISVETLKSEFGVSKQPVMESLRLLSADGLIEIIPQVGSVVSTYSEREIADFYDMFAGFEGAIAAAAAARRTHQQLEQLEMISLQLARLTAHDDAAVRAQHYRVQNRHFHLAIHQMADSRVMADTSRRMWDLSDFLINTAGAKNPLSSATASRHDDHEQIRAAIAEADSSAARQAMERHIRDTVGIILAEVTTQTQT